MNSPETPSTAPVAWCRSDDFRDAFLKRQSFNGWREKHSDCDMALYAQPQASPAPDADQVEGPSLDDVYELCQEFEFHLDECQGESAEILRDMITAAITRWRAPVAEPAPLPAQRKVAELVAALEADAKCVAAEQPDLMQLTDKQLLRIAELLKGLPHA